MPYIDPSLREDLTPTIQDTMDFPGELNFAITNVCLLFLKKHGRNYTTMNAIIGALECAKLEIYRRVAAPYENQKIAENGDLPGMTP